MLLEIPAKALLAILIFIVIAIVVAIIVFAIIAAITGTSLGFMTNAKRAIKRPRLLPTSDHKARKEEQKASRSGD